MGCPVVTVLASGNYSGSGTYAPTTIATSPADGMYRFNSVLVQTGGTAPVGSAQAAVVYFAGGNEYGQSSGIFENANGVPASFFVPSGTDIQLRVDGSGGTFDYTVYYSVESL